MKHYHYFVSYQYNNFGDHGFGQVNLLLKERIKSAEQIDEIRKYLADRFSYQGVVLINFFLLREEDI